MKIIICGTAFPLSLGMLRAELPDDDARIVEVANLDAALPTADVLIPMMTRLDARAIGATSARLIQQWGAGLEGVDLEAANARGIYVANVPSDLTGNAESTAEHALLLMLAAARRLGACARSFDEGTWGAPLGDALFGRRAVIVGFGRIGKALARRLLAMGMRWMRCGGRPRLARRRATASIESAWPATWCPSPPAPISSSARPPPRRTRAA